jgi:hypothetical protein
MNMSDQDAVASIEAARKIATAWARDNTQSEERSLALAETWFDAGKDFDACTVSDLKSYLSRNFAN